MTLLAIPRLRGEFRDGWTIILGAALAAGTGVGMVFLNFSLFILPLSRELGVSRGDLGSVQALIVTAALGAPLCGRAADHFGVRAVFVACTLLVAATHILAASFASSLVHMAVSIGLTGFFGIGSTAVILTRPINAHFVTHRGKALGVMAVGISVVSMASPPLVQWLLETWGWRAGFVGFAAVSILIGIPAVLFLLPSDHKNKHQITHISGLNLDAARHFLMERDFWLLTLSLIAMSLATAGTVSQLAPMIVDEGIDPAKAALALSFFAGGQFVGRLAGGWLLDVLEPRLVAFFLTLMPAIGFIILLGTHEIMLAAFMAAVIIGVQQGAELDIFAYFTSHRFGLARYGTIYGALAGFGWIGNVGGMVGMGQLYDHYGNYMPAQIMGIIALILSALLILAVRLPVSRS